VGHLEKGGDSQNHIICGRRTSADIRRIKGSDAWRSRVLGVRKGIGGLKGLPLESPKPLVENTLLFDGDTTWKGGMKETL